MRKYSKLICGSKHNNLKNSNVLSEIKSMTVVWVRFFFNWGHELVNVSMILPWWHHPLFWVRMPSVPARSRTSPELKKYMSRLYLVSSSFWSQFSVSNAVLCHFMCPVYLTHLTSFFRTGIWLRFLWNTNSDVKFVVRKLVLKNDVTL